MISPLPLRVHCPTPPRLSRPPPHHHHPCPRSGNRLIVIASAPAISASSYLPVAMGQRHTGLLSRDTGFLLCRLCRERGSAGLRTGERHAPPLPREPLRPGRRADGLVVGAAVEGPVRASRAVRLRVPQGLRCPHHLLRAVRQSPGPCERLIPFSLCVEFDISGDFDILVR